jgi:hypothetical protein
VSESSVNADRSMGPQVEPQNPFVRAVRGARVTLATSQAVDLGPFRDYGNRYVSIATARAARNGYKVRTMETIPFPGWGIEAK